MPNPELVEQGKKMREDKELLKTQYATLRDSSVLTDILRECDDRYEAEVNSGILELDNAHKSATALQRAHAYDIIRSYIRDMLM